MKFDNWEYWKQGEFERTDGLCPKDMVIEIDQPLTPVEPRTNLPTQFRTKTRHPFEMQSGCRAESMSGCVGYSALIFRTPDESTPDEVILPIGGENLIQRLPDGGIARWISWPPPWQSGKDAWYGLWRIEYPDGRIERFLPEIYADVNQAHAGYLQREQGSQGVAERQADGGILLKDGGGRTYARVSGERFTPFVLAIGTARQTIQHESSFTGGQFKSLNWARNGYEWAEQSSTYTTAEHARLVSLSRISRQAVAAMRPSEVVSLYYSTGRWQADDGNDYILARYAGGLIPISGTSVFLMETMIRQRLYAFRPDVHRIRLSDGNIVPGLLDWSIFPPLDGLQCVRKPPTGFGAILEKTLMVASMLLLAAIPGIGGLAISLGITYANANEKQRLLADQMKLMESGMKFTTLMQGAQAGAAEIVVTDPPTRADIERDARAAGEPVPTSTVVAGGGVGILMAVAALLAIA